MPNVRQQVQLLIDKALSTEANRQRLVAAAKSTLAETLASGKASNHYTTAVDGHLGAVETAQRVVTYRFAFIADAALFALDFLQARTPEASGKAARSFWLSVDGVYYAPGTFTKAVEIVPDAEVVIGNLVPQWRKMDINMVGSRSLHYTYPGDLDDCVRALSRQFGNAVTAKRLYDYNFPGKYKPQHASTKFQSPVLIIKPR